MGLAAGADYACCIKLIVAWFDRTTRGRAMGILMVASSLGVTATNAVVPTLAATFGWQGVYRVLGLITLAVGGAAFLLLRDRPIGAAPTVQPHLSLRPLLRQPQPAAAGPDRLRRAVGHLGLRLLGQRADDQGPRLLARSMPASSSP